MLKKSDSGENKALHPIAVAATQCSMFSVSSIQVTQLDK